MPNKHIILKILLTGLISLINEKEMLFIEFKTSSLRMVADCHNLMIYSRYIGEIITERAHGPSNAVHCNVQKKKNPIITVTEHTPTPSPDYLSKTRQVSTSNKS